MPRPRLDPITQKRLKRFRRTRRAWYSFWLLLGLYCVGLASEVICNPNPYFVRFEGESYFPFLAAYGDALPFVKPTWGIHPEDTFRGNGINTPPNYRALNRDPLFTDDPDNYMLWPPVPFGASTIVREDDLDISKDVTVTFAPHYRAASIDIGEDLTILASTNALSFLEAETETELRGLQITERLLLPPRIVNALDAAFRNEPTAKVEIPVRNSAGKEMIISLRAYEPRSRAPLKLRLRLEEPPPDATQIRSVVIAEDDSVVATGGDLWGKLTPEEQAEVLALVAERRDQPLDSRVLDLQGGTWRVNLQMDDFAFPFRPIGVHILGIDASGRDVFARILYALRLSMNFGFLLVSMTFALGIILGGVQGYFGGIVDIAGQRFIEVWASLPFLYIIILFGSIFGPSFLLLLLIYAVFNWIGISYYMRGEFLKLRQEPYIDAARVLGIPNWKIMIRHILPNALVPVITFFPFSLVGAIGALTALDFLGFGLPQPTPSWGELMSQYQSNTDAWWLVLYPFIVLFLVVLLGVLVGDGIRNAFDPRSKVHVE